MNSRKLLIAQGSIFLGAGIWPILNMKSFEAVTGPKTDHWLVKTVGALLAVSGGCFLLSVRNAKEVPEEIRLLACAQSIVLGSVELIYASKGKISKVYLVDALLESGLVAAWAKTKRPRLELVQSQVKAPVPWDVIDEASWESFPASDSPAW